MDTDTTPKEVPEIERLKVGDQIWIGTAWGEMPASITGFRWPHLTVDPVSVWMIQANGVGSAHTFASFTDFKNAFRGTKSRL